MMCFTLITCEPSMHLAVINTINPKDKEEISTKEFMTSIFALMCFDIHKCVCVFVFVQY